MAISDIKASIVQAALKAWAAAQNFDPEKAKHAIDLVSQLVDSLTGERHNVMASHVALDGHSAAAERLGLNFNQLREIAQAIAELVKKVSGT